MKTRVVALGADIDQASTPGLVETGNEFYTVAGAIALRDPLPRFERGAAIVGVTGKSGKCPALGRIDMAKVYLINCRDAGVDCDFQARGSSLEEVMQLCADHGIQEHNMKAFGPELYTKMRRCVKTLEEGTSGPTS